MRPFNYDSYLGWSYISVMQVSKNTNEVDQADHENKNPKTTEDQIVSKVTNGEGQADHEDKIPISIYKWIKSYKGQTQR